MSYLKTLIVFMTLALFYTKEMSYECPIIGIDIGTTTSRVGIYNNGQVEIIPRQLGNRTTPSVKTFNGQERLTGEIGNEKKHVSFKKTDQDLKPFVYAPNEQGEDRTSASEQTSATVLTKMKKIAERYTGRAIKSAIITVPTYFDNHQRQAIKDAAVIAGLNAIRVLHEPTAAAIAYGLDERHEQNILVFDLGGSKLDVSILTVEDGVFEIIGTHSDIYLGGVDFDNSIIEHLVKIIQNKEGKDISQDQQAIQKLKREVQKAKRTLSFHHEAKIQIENLVQGLYFCKNLTRIQFEEINSNLFKKTLEPVKLALEESSLQKSQVDEIILVGGSTRIPKIRQLVKEFFNGKKPNTGINPEQTICYGAALQGGLVCRRRDEIQDITIFSVTPFSLGIQSMGGVMTKIIRAGSYIPTKQSQIFQIFNNNQKTVTIDVYLGERSMAKDNRLLGSFNLTRIPAGQSQIQITFQLNQEATLSVTAVELGSENKKQIIIKDQSENIWQEQVQKMIRQAQQLAKQDLLTEKIIGAKLYSHGDLYLSEPSPNNTGQLKDKRASDSQLPVGNVPSLLESNIDDFKKIGRKDKKQKGSSLLSIRIDQSDIKKEIGRAAAEEKGEQLISKDFEL